MRYAGKRFSRIKVREIKDIQSILDRALTGERLTTDDCTALLESHDIARIGFAADEIRKRFSYENVGKLSRGGGRSAQF